VSKSTSNHVLRPSCWTIAGSRQWRGAVFKLILKAMSATGSYACSLLTAIIRSTIHFAFSCYFPIPLNTCWKTAHAYFSDLEMSSGQSSDVGRLHTIKLVRQSSSNIALKFHSWFLSWVCDPSGIFLRKKWRPFNTLQYHELLSFGWSHDT